MKPEHLTAWALKQLNPEEHLRLEQELRRMPAERQQASATRAFSQLLSHRLQDGSMSLTDAQRQHLIQVAKMSHPSAAAPFAPQPLRWWQRPAIPLLSAAAAVILVSATVWQHLETRTEFANASPPDLERLRVSPPLIVTETALKPMLHTGIPSRQNGGGQRDPMFAPVTPPTATSIVAPLPSMPEMKPIARQLSVPSPPTSPAHMVRLSAEVQPPQNSVQHKVRSNDGAFVSASRQPRCSVTIQASTPSSAELVRLLKANSPRGQVEVELSDVIRAFPSEGQGPQLDSKHPLSVDAEMAPCPWEPNHRLARIHLQGRDAAGPVKALQLVFLIDVSSSMNAAEKLPMVKRTLHRLLKQLGAEDRVSMITSGDGTNVHLASTDGSQKQRIIEAIEALEVSAQNGDGKAGIQLAFDQAKTGFIKDGVNQVILCTDGDFHVEEQDSTVWQAWLRDYQRNRLSLSVFAFGETTSHRRDLERLPQLGEERSLGIDLPSQAALRICELKHGTAVPLAKEVKIQVEFNADVVKAYRLLGYQPSGPVNIEAHRGSAEEFELATGQGVTALYEIIPVGSKSLNQPSLVTEEQKPHQLASPPTMNESRSPSPRRALTLQVRYKLTEGSGTKIIENDLSENVRPLAAASRELKFSAAVVGFGMLRQGDSQNHQLTWEQVRRLAQDGLGEDRLGSREEFLQLIDFIAKR